jgi:hypothetical protein
MKQFVSSTALSKSLLIGTSALMMFAFQNCGSDFSEISSSPASTEKNAIQSGSAPASSIAATTGSSTSTSTTSSLTPPSTPPKAGPTPSNLPSFPPPIASDASYEFSKEFRLVYLSLRNIEPSTAGSLAGLIAIDKDYKSNPTAQRLYQVRTTLVDVDNGLATDIVQMCKGIGMESTSCISQTRAYLKGGVNIFDVANRFYVHQLVLNGTCGAVNEAIGVEFATDFGVTPACDQWKNLTNLYASYSLSQIHADFANTSFLNDQISKYLSANGGSQSEISFWHDLVAQSRLSLQDVRINIQVYK